MTSPDGARVAWRDGDIVLVSATTLVGLIAIVASWFGADGTHSITTQAAWLNLAVAGFAIFAAGNCLWLLRGRRAIGARRVSLVSLDAMDEVPDVQAQATDPSRPAAPTASMRWVRATGMQRVHLPDCPLVAGKPVRSATLSDGRPCGVCTI